MNNLRSNLSLVLSAIIYLMFNLRLGVDLEASIKATLWQFAQTVPYIAGVTYVIIALLQYMAGGEKLPWDRRLRLFLAIGIMAGLVLGIYEYAGVDVKQQ